MAVKKPTVPILKTRARVVQHLGHAGAGCHGTQSLGARRDNGDWLERIDIPGWDLPPGTEVEVKIKVTVIKLGKRSKKRCENPWPAHICDDGVYRKRKR